MGARKTAQVFCLLLVAGAGLAGRTAHAQGAAEQPLEYRRIFVPADRPQDWPKRNVPYLPVEREEFERLLNSANARPPSPSAACSARIVRAVYQAEIKDDSLHGQAHLEIKHSDDHAVLMPLEPLGLAISSSKWEKEGPAIVGLADSEKTTVLVARSGTLVLDWSLRGRRDASGGLVFNIDLPLSAVGQLNLELPDSMVPVLDDAVVVANSVGQKRGEWRFQLGGRTNRILKFQASEAHSRQMRLALLQEKTTYRFSLGGLDVASQLKLDVFREPLRRLQFDIDPQLRVVSVQYGGNELSWSVDVTSPGDRQTLSVDFAEPLIGTGKVLSMTALAPLVVGKPLRLPRWEARDVIWQEGEATLVLPPPLALDTLLPEGCRQMKATPAGGSVATGESVDLQLFSAGATAEVQVSRRRQQIALTSGSTVRFASNQIRAEMRGSFESVEGQAFSLQADVGRGWEIDSVTADRPGALAGWSINRATRPPSLVVQLAEPLRPAHALMLMVTGHRSGATDYRFTSAVLDMLSFHECVERRRLLALETSGAHRVWLDGPDRPALTGRSKLNEAERALLASALGDTILEFDPRRVDWSVAIEPQSPRYSAELRATAECLGDRLIESYSVRCEPEASRLNRVLLAFSQAHDKPLQFSYKGGERQLSAIRLSTDEQSARGLADAGEVWLVNLMEAADDAFELRAVRDVPFADQVVPALVSVPDAHSQQAVIEIAAQHDPPSIRHADRLEPMPLAAPSDGHSPRVRAAFRYDPIEELGGDLAEAVILSRRDKLATVEPAMIWRLRLHSQYLLSGGSRNLAILDLENQGRSRCSIGLPNGAELLHVAVDGLTASVQKENNSINVPLPAGGRFPVIAVEYYVPGSPLGIVNACRAPWPSADLAIVDQDWLVSIPAGYQACTGRGSPFTPPWPLRIDAIEGREQGPFDAVTASQIRNLATGQTAAGQQLRLAEQLLEAVGRKLATGDAALDTWGRLLAAVVNEERTLLSLLSVDALSLSQLDVGPSTALDMATVPLNSNEQIRSEAAQALAAELLRSFGLVVLAADDRIVLTTRWVASEAANDRGASRSDQVVFSEAGWMPSGQRPPDRSRYVSVPAWQSDAETRWEKMRRTAVVSGPDVESRISGPGGAVSLWLIRRDVIIAAAAAACAIAAALSTRLRRTRHSVVILVAGLASAAAIWSPPPLDIVPWGAVAGYLAAVIWHWLRPASRDERDTKATAMLAAAGRGAGTALPFLLATIAADGSVYGQEPAQAAAKDDKPPVHNVFVPLDAGGKPGGLYQVPLDFLDELRRRATTTVDEPRGWLVTSAAYQCSLSRVNPEEQVGIGELLARFELHVMSPDAHIALGFDRRQVDLASDSSLLDGQPIDLVWDDDGTALVCDVADPGDFVLEFRLLPMLSDDAESRSLDMVVPQVVPSTVDVSFPADVSGFEFPNSLGDVRMDEAGRHAHTNLGRIGRLTLRWARQPAALAQVDVAELLWLKIRPGSVVLDVDLNYDIDGGHLRQIQFAADRRLRLMPSPTAAKERTLPSATGVADSLQVTQIDLEQPAADRLPISLSFLLSGASGVGNVRLPTFQLQNAHVSRRWLAVTVHPALQYEAHNAERLEALPVADFIAAWHDADPAAFRDALAYRLDGNDIPWSLSTRSREPQTAAKETLALSFERSNALVRYSTQLLTTGGFVFQHRLRVPADLQISDVVLEEEGLERALRWAHSDDQHVTVFLSRRVTGAQQLRLEGRLPIRANGRFSLPSLSIEATAADPIERVEVVSRTIELYRHPQVHIALENAEGLDGLSQPASEPVQPELGRLVLSGVADATYSGTIVVSPNQPRIADAKQFMLLRYSNQAWIAELDYRFDAERGVIDAVTFDVPANWGVNLEVLAPPATIELADQPGRARKVLTVRPLKPLNGSCQLRIRSPLKSVPGEPIAAPDVVPMAGAATDCYWCLPNQVGIEAVTWDVERMAPAMLPDSEPAPYSDGEAFAVFRSIGDHPQAVMGSTKATTGAARVRLADVDLAMNGESWEGIAAFDIEPGGRSSCNVRLASGWRLNAASVNGLAAAALHDGENLWQIPFSSNRLPQQVELLVQRIDQRAKAESGVNLPVAWIEGWPVEESLLSLHLPPNIVAGLNAARIEAATGSATRIESAMSLIDLPEEVVATTAHEDLVAWCQPWIRRLHWSEQGSRERESPARSAAFENWLRVARRLQIDAALADLPQQPLVATQPTEIWNILHRSPPAALFHWSGDRNPGELVIKRSVPQDWRTRGLATACLMFAVAAALALPRFAVVAEFPRRWPYLTIAAIGLIWWLFCQPSVGGWLLVVAGLVGAVYSAVRPLQSSRNA